jgi:O-acetylhomoserine/O-acetylserine sulfhydrylase-like pyridoxal-dependent enzyme
LTYELGCNKNEANYKVSKIFAHKKKNGKSGLHRVLSVDLKEIIGKSLEEDTELWIRFNHLRTVRKNIIHPITTSVLQAQAADCILTVRKIINWTTSIVV